MAVDITKRPATSGRGNTINLEKKGAAISLDKGRGFSKMVVNLNWNQGKKKTGAGFLGSLFGSGTKSVDLDLGCLFELKDGSKGAIQALGNAFGNYSNAPYIQLMGDDRTGDSAEGEFIHINGEQFEKIKRIVVYAFIYDGVASWAETDALITLSTPGHDTIKVNMDGKGTKSLVAIAMIENVGNDLKITKLVDFFDDQEKLDRYYNWGMNWSPGRK